ncbi:MAG: ATP-binding cassette domain-containing protein [Clostridia bacterium]
MNFILEISIYLYLGYKLLVGGTIGIGEFTLYGNAIRQFKDSMSNLLSSFADIDNNGRYIKDYFAFIEIQSEFNKSHECLPKLDDISIRFEHVSFIYPNQDKYALKDINITITNKTCLSLVGENGSGKTTFVKLLTRLCDPTEGNIYLNDINIKDIEYAEYQKIFSVIFQDFNLYAFSIRENITMLAPPIANQDSIIMDTIDKVGLKPLIEKEKKESILFCIMYMMKTG